MLHRHGVNGVLRPCDRLCCRRRRRHRVWQLPLWQVARVAMQLVYVTTQVGVPQQQRHMQPWVLSSQRHAHCCAKGATAKHHHLLQSALVCFGRFPLPQRP